MATQPEYTAGANALMHLIYVSIGRLPPWEQDFIPKDKIPAAAGAGAKVVIDALDEYRAAHPSAATREKVKWTRKQNKLSRSRSRR